MRMVSIACVADHGIDIGAPQRLHGIEEGEGVVCHEKLLSAAKHGFCVVDGSLTHKSAKVNGENAQYGQVYTKNIVNNAQKRGGRLGKNT